MLRIVILIVITIKITMYFSFFLLPSVLSVSSVVYPYSFLLQ